MPRPTEPVIFQIAAEGYVDRYTSRIKPGNDVARNSSSGSRLTVQLAAIDARTREAIPRFSGQKYMLCAGAYIAGREAGKFGAVSFRYGEDGRVQWGSLTCPGISMMDA